MANIRASFVFEGIPWVFSPSQWLKTSTIGSNHFSQPFLSRVEDFESTEINEDLEYLEIFRRHAGLDNSYGTHSEPDNCFAQFYSILMAYRLLDVLTARNSVPDDWVNECYPEESIEIPQLKLDRDFNNWVGYLSTFSDSLAASMVTPPKFLPGSTSTYLFGYVCRANQIDNVTRTLLNIGVAALHLHHLLRGHMDLVRIGDAVEWLLSETDINTQAQGFRLTNFKNPLHLALSLSPILLFVPVSLIKKGIGRQHILKAWKALGRQKPQDIHTAERYVWSMLLDMASGQCSIEGGVRTCLDTILKSTLVQTPWHDWFCVPSRAPESQQTPAPSTNIRSQFAPPLTPMSPLGYLRRSNQVIERSTNWPSSSTAPQSRYIPSTPSSQDRDQQPVDPQQQDDDEDMDQEFRYTPNAEVDDGGDTNQPGPSSQPSREESRQEVGQNEQSKKTRKRKKPETRADVYEGTTMTREKRAQNRQNAREGIEATDHEEVNTGGPPMKKSRREAPYPARTTPFPPDSTPNMVGRWERPVAGWVKVPPGTTSSRESTLPPTSSAFKSNCLRKYVTSVEFFNVFDQKEKVQLEFHDAVQKTWFQSGIGLAKLHGGRSLYLAQVPHIRDSSCIKVMTRQQFDTQWRDLVRIFQQQHIVVTGEDRAQYKFDAEGLDTILPTSWDRFGGSITSNSGITFTTFTDQSTSRAIYDIPQPTDAMTILISAHERQVKLRDGVMVSYTIPKIDGPLPHHSLATDIYANRVWCSNDGSDCYHSEYMRWGHASTVASYRTWQIQCAGYFESIVCGSQLFFIANPRGDSECPPVLFEAETIATPATDLFNPERWDIEAVIVPAGSEIYIRPLTPYASISLTSSISHGAFFFPGAMIERIIVGIYRSFASNGETPTLHYSFERLSQLILFLWKNHFMHHLTPKTQHIPDLETLEGLRQLLCLCCYRELAYICTEDSYTYPDLSKGLHSTQRRSFIDARNVSRELIEWFDNNFTLELSEGGQRITLLTVATKYLAGVVKALLHQTKEDGNDQVTQDRMKHLVDLVFEGDQRFWDVYPHVTPSYDLLFEGTIDRNRRPRDDEGSWSGYTHEDEQDSG
ncbi:hypothetical protein BDN72DRAFT_901617 [Pluteus cervinus]|uniref:Uncharacterized protein n=1 Tax=Pluteus cervinus TaxID=181527 RepID=A0ACD3AF52_9AGAR|nr:hypothetical protein BDN72DRAFT_901617 [Pluteus cervinus]